MAGQLVSLGPGFKGKGGKRVGLIAVNITLDQGSKSILKSNGEYIMEVNGVSLDSRPSLWLIS